ncbi:siderophore-interacting protein [Herbaspirillum sp. NPDC101396]|uniref:siderophore-interacting protein n=1 Tax=Herbaspirillum sp. NPDC101396 TaxID=3364005 RepID=UPI00383A883D
MTASSHATTTTTPRQTGGFSKALLRLFMKRAVIVATENLAGQFHLLTLESPAFRGVAWQPGQKVQIAMGSAFVARTFTPVEWHAATGRTRLLGYAHGAGPGSDWLREARKNDECDVFGPRSSLDTRALTGPVVIFGDETSIGLACALQHRHQETAVQSFLETDDMDSVRAVAAHLGIGGLHLSQRVAGDAHLQAIVEQLAALASTGSTFLLTGKAQSIQRLHRGLKSTGVPGARILTKAYWAPGKTGLD